MTFEKVELFRQKLRIIEREIEDQLKNGTVCCGVSLSQCHTLMELGIFESTTISNLASMLKLDKSTLSRTIEGMVQIGLVNREIDPSDRRYMRIGLTDQGRKTFKSINGFCNDFYTRIFEYIPKNKQDQVIESVTLLTEAFHHVKKS